MTGIIRERNLAQEFLFCHVNHGWDTFLLGWFRDKLDFENALSSSRVSGLLRAYLKTLQFFKAHWQISFWTGKITDFDVTVNRTLKLVRISFFSLLIWRRPPGAARVHEFDILSQFSETLARSTLQLWRHNWKWTKSRVTFLGIVYSCAAKSLTSAVFDIFREKWRQIFVLQIGLDLLDDPHIKWVIRGKRLIRVILNCHRFRVFAVPQKIKVGLFVRVPRMGFLWVYDFVWVALLRKVVENFVAAADLCFKLCCIFKLNFKLSLLEVAYSGLL